MKVDNLISPLVPYEDYEGTMVLFDIITDEYRNALVKLLPHVEGSAFPDGSVTGRDGKAFSVVLFM